MKATFSRLLVAAVLSTAATGCNDFLDINENPNSATSVTPDAQLASALVTTAANYTGGIAAGQNYNSYSSFATGYWGKSGTVSGFSEERTYNYTTNYYQNLWTQTYDNLNDYNLIQQNGKGNGYDFHAAIARIMKAYNFLLLVDQYGDIPYTNALKGLNNTAPSYDKQADIYKDLIVQLKGAIDDINAATAAGTTRAVGTEDVVFGGGAAGMTKWKQFANSLRLRILLRESQTSQVDQNYLRTELTAVQTATDGFITHDVVVQPTYGPNQDQQNPFYNRYGYAVGLPNATAEYSYVMPTNYIIRQYESNNDPRITQLYRLGRRTVGGTATSQYVGTDLGEANPPTFVSTNATIGSRFQTVTATNPQGGTFLRGPGAPVVIMLLSEHLFNKAEAETRGLFTGTDVAAKEDFLNGIKASFVHTYRTVTTRNEVNVALPTDTASSIAGIAQYNLYLRRNRNNPLVNYDQAPSNGALGKQAVIIYQKYLAENTVAATEAWADYRRTGLPKFPASLQSASPRPDKLPTRLLYPQTEVSTNNTNLPTGVTQFTKIFWDEVD